MEHRQPRSSSAAWQPKQGLGRLKLGLGLQGFFGFRASLKDLQSEAGVSNF